MNGQKIIVAAWYRIGVWAANFFMLNLLFLVTAAGIVTLPPSLAAMMGTIIKWSETGDESVFFLYFSEWKRLAKKSYAVITPTLIITMILIGEWFFYGTQRSSIGVIMLGLTLSFSLVFISIVAYILPLVVCYDWTIFQLVQSAIYLGLKYWGRTTVRIAPVTLVLVALIMVFPGIFVFGVFPIVCWFLYHVTRQPIAYTFNQDVTVS